MQGDKMATFQKGEWITLKNLVGFDAIHNGERAYITNISLYSAVYYSYNLYDVMVPTLTGQVDLKGLREENLESSQFTIAVPEADTWPPVCTCDSKQICNYGCSCGAMEKERQMIEEGKNLGQDSIGAEMVIKGRIV